MKTKTEKEVKEFFEQLFNAQSYDHQEISVSKESSQSGQWRVEVNRMYEYVEVNFSTLKSIADWFDTVNVDVDEWSKRGCETCDYGSSYVKVFNIW